MPLLPPFQKHIDRIRQDYRKNLKAELMADRQKATAVYLIDQLALRAGNEKGEDEADTVGCCSLKFEHVTLKPPNIVIFDFLGKDSIRFYNEVPVDEQVFKNLKIFKKAPKGEGDEIFDRLKVRGPLARFFIRRGDVLFLTYVSRPTNSINTCPATCQASPPRSSVPITLRSRCRRSSRR